MTYLEMRQRVRIAIGETEETNSYFTDTEIDDMLNSSQLQVAMDTGGNLTHGK